ncbi:MAG: 2-C-methyl-D-erythritol 4-phosphate cytidylyltransferase [Treponema sp.]|jgi:2-C-methyl-D-erythritol 4-phosphate cytidylyltransferase/2-C-methyl-D-erythritol 4-phosphate cytidylyltransferase/2-C-methyl-D-erythritol 2,4-cyclodiphosphate synthase|nr:2-C-methyl-D-erythritol 4-phosphate cytidylyltransferase [Treponema sp.]
MSAGTCCQSNVQEPVFPSGIAAIICAAGSSSRFNGNGKDGVKKEYLPFGPSNTSVLGASVEAFISCPNVGPLVITVPPGCAGDAESCLSERVKNQGRVYFADGGKSRRESVHNALLFLKKLSLLQNSVSFADAFAFSRPMGCENAVFSGRNCKTSVLQFPQFSVNYVLIHDGARPWVSPALIGRVIEAMVRYKAVIPVVPALETPKLYDDSGFVQKHLRRNGLGFAQTPQGFAFPEILAAHEKAGLREREEAHEYTDDAEVWGEFIGPVAVVEGDTENRKITFSGDLRLC